MTTEIPAVFFERLQSIVPPERYKDVAESFSRSGPLSVRINTRKTNKQDILSEISAQEVSWADEALILKENSERVQQLVDAGVLYRQGLSSMLPVIVLDPKPGEHILDMCAAPGSKTTQMAARMNNGGRIDAVEAVRGRYYKLKSVIELLGATNTKCYLMDARRFRARDGLYDKILVDAPCSSEGRFCTDQPKTFAYWSPRKIKEMMRKQRGLLLSASRLLKPGGTMVYSTCTFAPEENEGVVDWLMRKTDGQLEIQDTSLPQVNRYPTVPSWGKKNYCTDVEKCFRVLPEKNMEGFFMARFKKESTIDDSNR